MTAFSDHGARRAGFTLVELVLVVTIIAILAGAVMVQATNRTKMARRARALEDVRVFELALDMYTADNGAPPTTEQGLAALRKKPTAAPVPRNWNGPYIKKAVPKDPWGNDYVYRSPGQENPDSFDVISYGADGQSGGEDDDADITNFEEEGQ
jgi:general secretion pathway protein G